MRIHRFKSTLFLSFLLVAGLSAQTARKIPIGEQIAVGKFTSLQIDNVEISSTKIRINFYFFAKYSFEVPVGLKGAYYDDYKSVKIGGIVIGSTYTMKDYQDTPFSIEIERPSAVVKLTGINLGGEIRNASIRLSKSYQGTSDADLSAQIASVPYRRNPAVPSTVQRKDTEQPVIIVSSPTYTQGIFRTEEFSVIISGTVEDNAGIATVSINGKAASLKSNGRFQKRLKLKFGKNPIVITAIDINENKTTSRATIIREEIIEDDEFSDVDFAPESGKTNSNGVAVVIGIQDYRYAPEVSFALNDADIFREYLIKTFGYKRENIYFKLNERATKGEFEKIFSRNGWLANNITRRSEIIIFYAGHGAPDLESKQSYLIPFDIDPNYASTGYALSELYNNLGNLDAKSITVILDACFSGGSRDNKSLLADARPIYITVEKNLIPKNIRIFSAASGNEISSADKSKKHGLFTYFFLKGLNGDADKNGDRKITFAEMQEYVAMQVPAQAKKLGREQHPQFQGEGDNRILLSY